jgi:hypothetical protein
MSLMFLMYYFELNVDCVHWLFETVENGNKSSDFKKLLNILDRLGTNTLSNETLFCGVSYLVR